jgi:diguanylate cyclase (GGDEF)-like protein
LLQSIEQAPIVLQHGQISLSASMGIAGLTEEEDALPEILLERADQMLYQAKNSGRNHLRLWERQSVENEAAREQAPVDVGESPGG